MTAPTIQPGTRCQCGDFQSVIGECPGDHGTDHGICLSAAVRMVVVGYHETPKQLEAGYPEHPIEVPLCAPCAAYHEQKAGAK